MDATGVRLVAQETDPADRSEAEDLERCPGLSQHDPARGEQARSARLTCDVDLNTPLQSHQKNWFATTVEWEGTTTPGACDCVRKTKPYLRFSNNLFEASRMGKVTAQGSMVEPPDLNEPFSKMVGR